MDGSNRETGIGVYNSTGGTLSRDQIIETLVSGSYTKPGVSPISLSGAAVLTISPTIQGMTTHPLIWKEANFGVIFEAKNGYVSPGVVDIQGGIYVPAFDATIEEEIGLGIRMPRDAFIGGQTYLSVTWAPMTATSGTVKWGFQKSIANLAGQTGDTFASSQTHLFSVGTNSVALQPINSEVSIDLTAMNVDSILVGRLFRDATSGDDTYAGDAAVVSARLIYQSDKLGTPERVSPYTSWS